MTDIKTQPRKANEEQVIYLQGNIRITNMRAVFGGKTYSVGHITSVSCLRHEPSRGLEFACGIFGLFCLAIGFSDFQNKYGFLIVAVLSFVGFYVLSKSAKPTFSVNLTTSSGEVNALTSPEEKDIMAIVESLNNAIIQKG